MSGRCARASGVGPCVRRGSGPRGGGAARALGLSGVSCGAGRAGGGELRVRTSWAAVGVLGLSTGGRGPARGGKPGKRGSGLCGGGEGLGR